MRMVTSHSFQNNSKKASCPTLGINPSRQRLDFPESWRSNQPSTPTAVAHPLRVEDSLVSISENQTQDWRELTVALHFIVDAFAHPRIKCVASNNSNLNRLHRARPVHIFRSIALDTSLDSCSIWDADSRAFQRLPPRAVGSTQDALWTSETTPFTLSLMA